MMGEIIVTLLKPNCEKWNWNKQKHGNKENCSSDNSKTLWAGRKKKNVVSKKLLLFYDNPSVNYWGSRYGAVLIGLASHQCDWGSIPSVDAIIMWVEFVVGSHPCSQGFSLGTLVFLPPPKSTFLNPISTWKHWMKEPLCGDHRNSH